MKSLLFMKLSERNAIEVDLLELSRPRNGISSTIDLNGFIIRHIKHLCVLAIESLTHLSFLP